ncbi:YacC family pilotin-like protein [Moellerella wisconsensis]|uniref:YacC family pilotin-like protein n=2 Tax=Moellerella wisconsensis TaxID=158849 RepID=A0A9Q8V2Y5_9GAMM|nr:YacC family pilotin-like protein [Moellerella wisconsensis]KLN96031.1 bacterial chaperone lipo family protein [Moellerella wisconsensis]UNH23611.1 YacC family pilotin-like protein [Moellerella wisconsensis]UNH26699.1 YacC family pilotin-like protein [Moellerella wisconsensis]UNH30183.1 YacC family pilotin-like protein [Moellerella wisconsensis]UNH38342.1 YacC family pilotin-like protein [Moellerella wisconsensis]
MHKIILFSYIVSLLSFSGVAKALSPSEAEDLADLTAVFVYLKYDCGYSQIPDREIERAIIYFAQTNKWDLTNYNSLDMSKLNKESYTDLKGIPLSNEFKCQSLARDSLGLFAYVK